MRERLRGLVARGTAKPSAPSADGSESITAPTSRTRLLLALSAGVIAGVWVWILESRHPGAWRDFDPLWVAGRALIAGENPYRAVGESGWPWPLYHPLPAVVADLPFTVFTRQTGRIVFVAGSTAFLAWAVTKRALWPLLFLIAAPFRHAVTHAQMSPALTAAALTPVLSGLLVVKPNIGLALFLSRPSRWTVAGGIALVAISTVIWPGWPIAWWAEARRVTHLAPVIRPWGALLLLALLRVRLPEGRLLAALALIPHRPVAYDMLPLLVLVPRSWKEMLFLIAASEVAMRFVNGLPATLAIDANDAASWPAFLAFVYIPALILVLLRPRTTEWRTTANGA